MNSNFLKNIVNEILTIESYFCAHDIVTGGIRTKSSLQTIQNTFNHWQNQCDLSLNQLSLLIACLIGDNQIQLEEVNE